MKAKINICFLLVFCCFLTACSSTTQSTISASDLESLRNDSTYTVAEFVQTDYCREFVESMNEELKDSGLSAKMYEIDENTLGIKYTYLEPATIEMTQKELDQYFKANCRDLVAQLKLYFKEFKTACGFNFGTIRYSIANANGSILYYADVNNPILSEK